MDSIDQRIRAYEPLIEAIAYLYLRRTDDLGSMDEYVQHGRIVAWKAIKKYDPSRGATERTYVGLKIKYGMRDYARELDHVPRHWRNDENFCDPHAFSHDQMFCDDGKESKGLDRMWTDQAVDNSTPENYMIADDLHKSLVSVIKSHRHGEKFKMSLMGVTGVKIGEYFGFSEARASHCINQAKNSLIYDIGLKNIKHNSIRSLEVNL